ncbi:enoyl-CoA hydratase/isomerase family protein [Bradyrhizobium sp. ma5]|uniref:enoyl-CoA hydratase/isomerase family protein n=1 Tax=Bradyrhizobium sp. ma5 TaxID=3344828 RepID=UPI0035D4EF71
MPLLHEKRGQISILTFSNPERRNAWHEDYWSALLEIMPKLERDADTRCVVITGDEKGRAFCAGADLKDERAHSLSSLGEFVESLAESRRLSPFELIGDFAKPTIAAVNGYAIGIGAILTFCCDLVVASEQAEWRLPQASLGILPAAGASARLSRWIGKGNAMRMALGFPFTAQDAQRAGLAQWLVPPEELMTHAGELAAQIAALPPLSARLTKESLNYGVNLPLPYAALGDMYRFALLEMTEDKSEAHEAWRERRKPLFRGR